jgi:hypothetical protein
MLVVLVSCHRASSSFIDRTLRRTRGGFRFASGYALSMVSSGGDEAFDCRRVCFKESANLAISSCCFLDSGSLRGGGGTCNGKTSVKKSADKKLRSADGLCS